MEKTYSKECQKICNNYEITDFLDYDFIQNLLDKYADRKHKELLKQKDKCVVCGGKGCSFGA
jgi:hypothetical protein